MRDNTCSRASHHSGGSEVGHFFFFFFVSGNRLASLYKPLPPSSFVLASSITKADVAAISFPTLKCAQTGGFERTRNRDGNNNRNTNWQRAEILTEEEEKCPFPVFSISTQSLSSWEPIRRRRPTARMA